MHDVFYKETSKKRSKSLEIGGTQIGQGKPVFVIAEAGVNHNGDPEIALQLIKAAKEAGAHCVKFQTFKSEQVASREAPKAAYQLKTTNPHETQLAMLQKLELPLAAYKSLMEYATSQNIVMISTPYNTEDVDFLDEINIPAFKMASIHLVEPSFLRYVAQKGKPMIVSTGMGTLDEVRVAIDTIRDTGNQQIVLLQCTTNYPSRIQDTNLRAMLTMRNAFDTLVGYSDHTQSDTACIGAVALGACVIEKHFTLDVAMEGPDHIASADPKAFAKLMDAIREAEAMLGSWEKEPCEMEKKNAPGMRRSIYAKVPIRKGEVIRPEMLIFKRPAHGVSPMLFHRMVGSVAHQDILADQPLSFDIVDEVRS